MTEAVCRRRWWLVLVPVAILAVPIGLYILQSRSCIRVTVQNTGSTALSSVVLHVTGKSYSLGDIAAGRSADATVKPTSKSHLEIEFTDSNGNPRRLNVGGYFQSDDQWTIRVSIKDDAIDECDHQISLR